ncbi:hypothetical protein IFT67_01940 [Sphingomonas sp. CFBP 13728]|uniref:hypothetical protein n=1 Tax=Sphingomonas sp. CFBP 13728 TaxID=2775294 RepID=UPI001781B68C|nr:hypothetical protein [Sphingomonas sp. CFBP 13728]MBD8617679.1 hypothetical protein [Sphingomonas sp. CFBP 13728]
MLSTISPTKLLARVASNPLQRPAARMLLETDGQITEEPGSNATTVGGVIGQVGPARTEASTDKDMAQKSAGNGKRTIVDQRTTDAGPMRITVIAYSDGSTETLQEVKNVDRLVLAATPMRNAAPTLDKAMVIDRLA